MGLRKLQAEAEFLKLTQRENEVLIYISLGYSNKEISEIMHFSIFASKAHVAQIIKKLHAKNRTQATLFALYFKLINIDEAIALHLKSKKYLNSDKQ